MSGMSQYTSNPYFRFFIENRHLSPFGQIMESGSDSTVIIQGKEKIMLGSNNYLGLTTHPYVKEAAIKALEEYGTACTGSRLLNGNLILHEQLEERIATFLGKESAIVFSTGFFSNLGTIGTLANWHDTLLCDSENHASIMQGALLSRAAIKRYRHNHMDHLERQLQKEDADSDADTFVITDGVFSMLGDICNLPELLDLCKTHKAMLILDDAHGIGVLGESGKGTEEYYHLDGVDLITGTFSKALASIGGFAAGPREIIDPLRISSLPFIFSASLPPASTATALAALDIIEKDASRRKRLWEITDMMMKALTEMGMDVGHSQTPIIPIIVGDDKRTFQAWSFLFDRGIFCNVAFPPAVQKGRELLRTSYIATHTDAQLNYVIDQFRLLQEQSFWRRSS